MPEYEHQSGTKWEWKQGEKHHTVRFIPEAGRLVWGSWVETANGTQFDEGFAQSVEDFLANGIEHLNPPEGLLVELKEAIGKTAGDYNTDSITGSLTEDEES